MIDLPPSVAPLHRMPTGIDGLDHLLHGGLFVGGTYLIVGPTGTGKTILVNQVSFNTIAGGGRVLYLSLFAEQHAQMFAYLQAFQFFNPDSIGQSLVYFSVYNVFESDGWQGLLTYMRQEIRRHRATLVVLDGLPSRLDGDQGVITSLRFLHDMQSFIYSMQATLLLTTIGNFQPGPQPEQMVVDGIITLGEGLPPPQEHAEISIRKFRGSAFVRGTHRFAITPSGISITAPLGTGSEESGP